MGRPFRGCGRRTTAERRHPARPSYGGEREPDSHPTPGPPTVVQSARVQLPRLAGSSATEQPGGCPFSGRLQRVQFAGRAVALDTSAGLWLAGATRSARPAPAASPLPARLEAAARVFPPAGRYVGDHDVEVPWPAVAAANATT